MHPFLKPHDVIDIESIKPPVAHISPGAIQIRLIDERHFDPKFHALLADNPLIVEFLSETLELREVGAYPKIQRHLKIR